MERAHGFLFCIHQQDRGAVSGKEDGRQPRKIRDQAIATSFSRLAGADNMNQSGMNLPQRNQRPRFAFRTARTASRACLQCVPRWRGDRIW